MPRATPLCACRIPRLQSNNTQSRFVTCSASNDDRLVQQVEWNFAAGSAGFHSEDGASCLVEQRCHRVLQGTTQPGVPLRRP